MERSVRTRGSRVRRSLKRRKCSIEGAGVILNGKTELLEVVLARHAGGGFAHFLDGGEQKPDQNGDDSNNDQQLDERKASSSATRSNGKHGEVSERGKSDVPVSIRNLYWLSYE